MTASPTRHFLGWNEPVLKLAVRWLAEGWTGGPLDLSDLLIVVPTRHSGRRLREALAAHASSRGQGVVPPRVETPHSLLATATQGERIADRQTALAVWVKTLQETDFSEYPTLFPSPPGSGSVELGWALACARRFLQVQHLLGETGDTVATVVLRDHAEHLLEEPERWADLARLEGKVLARLAELGFQHPATRRRAAAHTLTPPPGISRIVVLGVTDPLPLALAGLVSLARQVPVTVAVHAPPELGDAFDDWGRPRPEVWHHRPLEVPDDAIVLLPDPENQGEAVAAHLEEHGIAPDDVAVGVPDPDLIPHLRRGLEERGQTVFDPAGLQLRAHPVVTLLGCMGDLVEHDRYEALSSLLRHPDYLRLLLREHPELRVKSLLRELDHCRTKHLPERLAHLVAVLRHTPPTEYGQLRVALAQVEQDLAVLRQAALGEGTLTFLSRLYENRELVLERPEDKAFQAAAGAIAEALGHFDSPLYDTLGFQRGERLRLLQEALSSLTYSAERERHSVELLGWLELHFDDAPFLVVSGMNDGRVPETIVGDAFVPDGLRQRLGLATNHSRFARDAYLAAAMLHCRPRSETSPVAPVLFLVGKTAASGDPLRPSRLLFLCPDPQLPERAGRLFREAERRDPPVVPTLTWRLRPPAGRLPSRLSASALRDYLACPFRFYLKRVLRMETVDDRQVELDALGFGNLLHQTLEDFGREPGVRDSDDPKRIAEFLLDALSDHLRRRLGRQPPVAVRLQSEAARQRLFWAARLQAEERRQGWRIIATEEALGGTGTELLGGFELVGRADRVDEHEDGRLRVLDYKTGDRPVSPAERHLKAVREETPDWQRTLVEGKERRFVDLQLPLYAHYLAQRYGRPVQAGLFSVPKAVTETEVAVWEGLTPALVADAMVCADRAARAIADWQFWPPSRKVQYDDFEFLLGGDGEAAVDGEWFQELLAAQRAGGER